ncbi:alpha/beta hydrolase family protein [Pedobacter sp. SYP-B3415]|uniref:alpha/beta hydrolase n=1 Tax=Pedobacter sp. SYP-B3415 TaxID=2496641 RepID=UPI00101D1CF9|nr:alpha/beta hydrolase family protein [Pedobacter sp. SYP-B3415]
MKLRFFYFVSFVVLLAFPVLPVLAAKVDTVITHSASMKKDIKAVVVLPEGYDGSKTYPVVYLLHGYGDRYDGWVKKFPAIQNEADRHKLIIVCPDGNIGSWYFDSPVDKKWRYETYVSTELVQWIDKNYKTIADRRARAITGLSMGGHGALYLAIKHQEVFGAAGSMSGGVDIRPFPNNWDLARRLGPKAEFPERWAANSVIEQLHLLTPGKLALIIDCGKGDFFYDVNVALHEKLDYLNINHDFIIRPGVHNWEYWSNAVGYQLLYFSRFFRS